MVKLNNDFLRVLEKILYKKTGQKFIVRDADLLDSAINSVFQTFSGVELYQTIEEKGARLGFNIINNHPYVDGNKRMGMLAMLSFFKINNINLKYSNNDIINVGLNLASGKMSYNELLNWVKEHKVNNKQLNKKEEIIKL